LIIHLKDEFWEYASEAKLEKILKRYSNFVAFPILLNGKRVNTLQAIWVQDPKTVKSEDYTSFYKFIHTEAVDEPFDTYHFRADAPLDVKALFFIPTYHGEKHGMGRMDPGVSLYCRKILIESKSKDIVPDWMRFVKGVVDSEDLPLSISREKPQDSALIAKLRTTLVRKFIAHLHKMAKKEPEKYLHGFYNEYNFFLKEGVCQDKDFQTQIAKLLRFESSHSLDPFVEPGQQTMISLDEYVSRMRPEQKDIYFLIAPTRDAALNSPYLEAFESAGVEVLIAFSSIDEFAMANLEKYEGRKLVSVESGEVNVKDLQKKDKTDGDKSSQKEHKDQVKSLSSAEALEFCDWFKNELGEEKVSSCSVSERLTTSPALVVDNEASGYRRMMRVIGTNSGEEEPLGGQSVEINTKHPIIIGVFALREKEPVLAATIAEQIFDNCLLAAGLLDDGRSMIPRLNGILESVIKTAMPPPTTNNGSTTRGSATAAAAAAEVVDFDQYTPQADTVDMDAIEAEIVSKHERDDHDVSSSSSSDSEADESSAKPPPPPPKNPASPPAGATKPKATKPKASSSYKR
jgi:TNF receptor-associated protein 1